MFLTDLKDTGKTLYFTMHYTDREEEEYKTHGNTQELCFEHEELEPCRHCGGKGEFKSHDLMFSSLFYVECKKCGKRTISKEEGQKLSFKGQKSRYIGMCEVIKELAKEWNRGLIKGNTIKSMCSCTVFSREKENKYRYRVEKIYGNCLEGAGLIMPKGAFARIDRNPKEVKEGDFVHCLNAPGAIAGSYIKQVSKIFDDVVIVKTNYKDPNKNFDFVAAEIMGLVTDVYDLESGERIYKREGVRA